MNKSRLLSHEQAMNNHEQVMKKSQTCPEQVKTVKSWASHVQVMKKSWTNHVQAMNKSRGLSHEKIYNSWTIHEQVMKKVINKSWTIDEQVRNKSSQLNHEQSEQVLNKSLRCHEQVEVTIPVGWRVVLHSCGSVCAEILTFNYLAGWVVGVLAEIKAEPKNKAH